MYLFFDRQGTLLEIVNDVAMRQYNTNVNKIYVHIQDDTAPESGRIPKHIVALKHWYLPYGKTAKDSIYGNPAVRPGTLTSEDTIWDENKDGIVSDSEKPATNSFVRETIPYNRNRDLKHFVYGRTYEFFVLNIPSGGFTATPCTSEGCMCAELSQEGDVFNFSGLVQGTIQTVHYDHSCLALERFSFTIEDSVLLPEKAVTGSQFSWLLTELLSMSGKVNGLDDYNNILANKPIINADLSSIELVADTYYKHTGEDGTYKTGVIYYYNGTKLIAIDGGTSLTLNGEETDNAAIYAPTKAGNKYQVLLSNGSGEPQWATVSIEKNGLDHTIKLGDDHEVGTITLPQETYIDSINYNPNTHIVTFKYNGASGKSDETVDLSDLSNIYTAGNGLQQIGNEFSIKTNSTYLSTSTNGLTVAAQSIADLAKIKLNGSSQIAKSTTFYAPTSAGSSSNILFSNGSGSPSWGSFSVNNGTAKSKSIFAPTSSRSTNSTNSCWVLVPNGSTSAPVWKELTVEKNGLTYTLELGGVEFGKIELTQEIYLDDVTYDENKNHLIFTYNTASGESQIEVDLTDLVDVYEAGNGLARDNGVFSIKIAPDSEKYLKATAEGLVFDESALPKQGASGNGGCFVAKTEAEMNALLTEENVGALVTYTGESGGGSAYEKDELYIITKSENAPIEVGETIETLYFNTSVEPDLSALTYDSRGQAVLIGQDEGSFHLMAMDFGIASGGQMQGIVLQHPTIGFLYCTEDLSAQGIAKGWQNLTDGALYGLSMTVPAVNQQDLWSSYISKEPFGTITEKRVGGVPSGGTAGQVLTKTTDNDYDAEWADVSGGVSDVQVNGKSIVSGGVANIPAADITTEGVLTTSSQSISGVKRFYDGISFYYNTATPSQTARMSVRSDNKLYIYKNNTYGGVCIGSNETKASAVSNVEINSSDGIVFKNPSSTDENYKSINLYRGNTLVSKVEFSYDIQGVVVALPKTWSTGTSGSVTLPSAGLYEVKVTKTFGEYDCDITAFVNFKKDGTKGAQSTAISYVNAGQFATTFIVVDPTGVMTFIDPTTFEGDTSITISYRKIGIA